MQITQILTVLDGVLPEKAAPLIDGFSVMAKPVQPVFVLANTDESDIPLHIETRQQQAKTENERAKDITPQSVVEMDLPFIPMATLSQSQNKTVAPSPSTAIMVNETEISPMVLAKPTPMMETNPIAAPDLQRVENREMPAEIKNVFVQQQPEGRSNRTLSDTVGRNIFDMAPDLVSVEKPTQYRRDTDVEPMGTIRQILVSDIRQEQVQKSHPMPVHPLSSRGVYGAQAQPTSDTDITMDDIEQKPILPANINLEKPHIPEFTRGHDMSVMRQIRQVLPDTPIQHKTQYDIDLAPKELGKVRIKVVPNDQNITISIHCDLDTTAQLMRRNLDVLTRDLLQMGFANINIDVGQNRPNTRSNSHPTSARHRGHDTDDRTGQIAEQTAVRPTPTGAMSRIDIKV